MNRSHTSIRQIQHTDNINTHQPYHHQPYHHHHHDNDNDNDDGIDDISPRHHHEHENDHHNMNGNDDVVSATDNDTDATPICTDDESLPQSPSHSLTQSPNTIDTAIKQRKPHRYRCRVCLSRKQNNKTKQLIQPCLCKGSMRWVHITCLNSWRSMTRQPLSHYRCENCLSFYDTTLLPNVAIKTSTLDYYILHPHIVADVPDKQYKSLQLQISHRRKQLLLSSSSANRKILRHLRRNDSRWYRWMRMLKIIKSIFYTFLPHDILLPLFIVSCCLFIEYRFVHHYELLYSLYYTVQFTILSLLIIPVMNAVKSVTTIIFQVEQDWWQNDDT